MSWSDAIVLGLIQGLTEFLPVSSSGHLALARVFLDYDPPAGALFEVMLHLGTAISILVVFAEDVIPLLRATARGVVPSRWRTLWRESEAFRTVALVLLSAVPAGVFGLSFRHEIESLFDRPVVVGASLIATGLLLASLRLVRPGSDPVGVRGALAMGCAQAIAVLPGISRSGATICAGLYAGCDRAAVGRFAFLMALVPILGAAALELGDVGEGPGLPVGPVVAGALVACGSGILALRLLLRFTRMGRLYLFAPYCIAVGLWAVLRG
jgi:undecaprenyl-diphosphatase